MSPEEEIEFDDALAVPGQLTDDLLAASFRFGPPVHGNHEHRVGGSRRKKVPCATSYHYEESAQATPPSYAAPVKVAVIPVAPPVEPPPKPEPLAPSELEKRCMQLDTRVRFALEGAKLELMRYQQDCRSNKEAIERHEHRVKVLEARVEARRRQRPSPQLTWLQTLMVFSACLVLPFAAVACFLALTVLATLQ